MLGTEAIRWHAGHGPSRHLTCQTRFPRATLTPDEQARAAFVEGRPQMLYSQVGNRLPIEDNWDGEVYCPVADRRLPLKFLSSRREVLGNPGIEHPAAVMEEPHDDYSAPVGVFMYPLPQPFRQVPPSEQF
jgi:hypothetical protein